MSSAAKKQQKQKKKNTKKASTFRAAPVAKKSGSLGRSLLTGAGSALGSLFGLSNVGSSVGNFVSDIVGLGAYKVNSNSLMSSSDSIPSFTHSDDSVTISHREYICDIKGSTDFVSQTYYINPSDPKTFPWLFPMAQQYEQYEFHGLVFAFHPTAGDAISSTNNALGTVCMATEYDISRPLFVSKQEMENYEYSTSVKPSSSMLHPIECNPRLDIINSRYTKGPLRKYAQPSDATSLQENLSHVGRLQVATVGMQASNINIGELWATYKVKFMKPRISGPSCFQGRYHITNKDNPTTASASGANLFVNGKYSTYTSSTSSLQSIYVNGNTLTLNDLPPNTMLVFTLSIISSGGISGLYSGMTPNNVTVNGEYFYSAINGTGDYDVQSGQSSDRITYRMNAITKDDNYVNPGSLSLGQFTSASGTFIVDFAVDVIPRINTQDYLLASHSLDTYSINQRFLELDSINEELRQLRRLCSTNQRVDPTVPSNSPVKQLNSSCPSNEVSHLQASSLTSKGWVCV